METEDDLGIRVWVGNLGKYVEGELKGGWANLPMPQRELNQFLRDTVGLGPEAAEARATGRVYEEYAIHDYEYDGLLEALDYRPDEYENLDDLNLLARAAQVFERESLGMIERVRMAADTLVQSTPLRWRTSSPNATTSTGANTIRPPASTRRISMIWTSCTPGIVWNATPT